MRVIIIEDTVYKCTENAYKLLVKKQKELKYDENGYKRDIEMINLIDGLRDKFLEVGVVEFDWRL